MSDILSRREREKLSHELEIIKAAEIIFSKKGFENSSMDEIAKASEFTKRTLYKYFTNKEDLFFAVVHKGFEKLFSYIKTSIKNGKNGHEKIRFSILAYYQFFKDHPDEFHLMNYIGFIKPNVQKSPKYKSFLEFDNLIFKELMKTIEEGKIDGSIRQDLETDNYAYSIVFLITGFFHELSISGKTFTKHFSLEEDTFSLFVIDLLTNTFTINNNQIK